MMYLLEVENFEELARLKHDFLLLQDCPNSSKEEIMCPSSSKIAPESTLSEATYFPKQMEPAIYRCWQENLVKQVYLTEHPLIIYLFIQS